MRQLLLVVLLCPLAAFSAKPKECISVDHAAKVANKDVCVEAHVYDVVELADGTRFLDVCAPGTPDAECGFTIVSLREDREQVGELLRYRHTDVRIRGVVQPIRGRSGMLLSHVRQFHGGPPKFRPNPKLLHGFTGEQSRPAVADPNLRTHGGHRGFMDARDQEQVGSRKNP